MTFAKLFCSAKTQGDSKMQRKSYYYTVHIILRCHCGITHCGNCEGKSTAESFTPTNWFLLTQDWIEEGGEEEEPSGKVSVSVTRDEKEYLFSFLFRLHARPLQGGNHNLVCCGTVVPGFKVIFSQVHWKHAFSMYVTSKYSARDTLFVLDQILKEQRFSSRLSFPFTALALEMP